MIDISKKKTILKIVKIFQMFLYSEEGNALADKVKDCPCCQEKGYPVLKVCGEL